MSVSVTRVLSKIGAPTLALGAAMIAVVLLAAVLMTQAAAANQMERRASAAAAQARTISENSLALLQAVTDAETGQRGYLLTGRADFLRPYQDGRARAERALSTLSELTRSNPELSNNVAEIRDQASQRLRILAHTVELAGNGRRAEALEFLPQGLVVMEDLRTRVAELSRTARRTDVTVRAERVAFDERAARLQMGLAAATLLALFVAIGSLAAERVTAAKAAAVRARMTEELEVSRRRAQEADAAKSRFLAAASHDLRQPLHALALYISTLERRIESEQAREILGNMDSAVRSMSRLFTALLDLARLEAGILKPEPTAFNVGDLLREIAAQSADPRGGKTRIRVMATDLQGLSDPDLLEIALRNLVSNAVKHSKGGRVLLGCRRRGDEVRIEVHDDGEGIPEDQLERLFSEFVRGEHAGSTEGIGLGLAIVERMAKLLGHKLSVSSRVGCGTVFSIVLPRAGDHAGAEPGPAPQTRLAGVRVLLADDEPLALDAMRLTLEDAGATVTTASSGDEVRATDDGAFDLYMFDLNFGRDDGLELLEALERRRGAAVPALIVTGATTPEMLERLRAAGRSWLTKPVTVPALTAAAAEVLAQR